MSMDMTTISRDISRKKANHMHPYTFLSHAAPNLRYPDSWWLLFPSTYKWLINYLRSITMYNLYPPLFTVSDHASCFYTIQLQSRWSQGDPCMGLMLTAEQGQPAVQQLLLPGIYRVDRFKTSEVWNLQCDGPMVGVVLIGRRTRGQGISFGSTWYLHRAFKEMTNVQPFAVQTWPVVDFMWGKTTFCSISGIQNESLIITFGLVSNGHSGDHQHPPGNRCPGWRWISGSLEESWTFSNVNNYDQQII